MNVPAKTAQMDNTSNASMKPLQENGAVVSSDVKSMPWNRLVMNPRKVFGAASQTRGHGA